MFRFLATALSMAIAAFSVAQAPLPAGVPVSATNRLDIARPSETVVLPLKGALAALTPADPRQALRVRDGRSGAELLSQAVDTDGDYSPDELVFQSDFGPGETRTFVVTAGPKPLLRRDAWKAYGRFVRERFDDFAWENDRIAHRMYGTALETWEKEPLTSSTVDIWCKSTRRLVVNDWYMVDDYHDDRGEGADFYSAGRSRGCGGSGIWEGERLFVSRNFIQTRVLANGPVRVMFELTYAPWDVNGRKISEVKRITLDAGWNLDRFESFYRGDAAPGLVYATGIKKGEGSTVRQEAAAGWLRTWEPVRKGQSGNVGCGIVLDPASVVRLTEADGNHLVVARTGAGPRASYYAGFAWDRSGDFADAAAWDAYLASMARRLKSPLEISVGGN
jgi:hypothetical protein